ncbi:MAG: hypothetical protein AAGG44_18870 [Planctomycetota bacterium]
MSNSKRQEMLPKPATTKASRRRLFRVGAAMFISASVAANRCDAQQGFGAAPPVAAEEKPSIFIKLDRFQKSVKQKMKQTFTKKSDTVPPARNTFAGRPQIPMNTVNAMRGNEPPPNHQPNYTQQTYQQQQLSSYPNQAYPPAANQYPGNMPNAAMPKTNPSPSVNWANFQQPPQSANFAASDFLNPNSGPVPQPAPPNAPNQGQYGNPAATPGGNIPAMGLPPSEYGIQLGGQHVTATEHALRLKAENEQLKLDRQSLVDRIERLLKELESTKRSLSKSGGQVESLNQQLEDERGMNRDLQRELTALKSEHQQSLLETDRMLSSIRAELDDLVMREVAANAK